MEPLGDPCGPGHVPPCGSRVCRKVREDGTVVAVAPLQPVHTKQAGCTDADSQPGRDRGVVACRLPDQVLSAPRTKSTGEEKRADRIAGSDRGASQVGTTPARWPHAVRVSMVCNPCRSEVAACPTWCFAGCCTLT